MHVILKACLRTAVKRKLLQNNPVEEAEGVDAEDQEAGTVLDEEELARLVRAFERRTLYAIVAFAAYTGARRNEILALRWIDINLDRCTVSITRSVERVKLKVDGEEKPRHVLRIKGPKKPRHARTIQIDAGLAALLRKEKARHLEWCEGKLPDGALAFPAVGFDLTAIRSPSAVTTQFTPSRRRRASLSASMTSGVAMKRSCLTLACRSTLLRSDAGMSRRCCSRSMQSGRGKRMPPPPT